MPYLRVLLFLIAIIASLLTSPGVSLAAERTIVFAAASLKTALDEIASAYREETGVRIVPSYAGTSILARQIQQGAPADIFISANTEWMDWLAEQDAIQPDSRIDLLSNDLVLIASEKERASISFAEGFDLAGYLGDRRIALALVDAVPAGIYAKAALTSLGQWESITPKAAQTDNVRAALRLVATGEAALGIVYGSDARAERRVSIVHVFDAG
ncbi:MAG: molybdate ABC transporter substrate-binding protein, partial [Pseudomonadota bacterium]